MLTNVLQYLYELCSTIRLPDDWGLLNPSPSIRRYAADGTALLSALRARFSAEELLQSGVARLDDGELRLADVLTGDPPDILFLREAAEAPPYDIVGIQGCLSTADPPCFNACRDFYTEQWSTRHKFLLAAFDARDVAVLRALGMPVTVAAGLGSIDGAQFRALCGTPGVLMDPVSAQGPPGDAVAPSDTRGRSLKILLAGWKVADLSPDEPPGLRPIAEHMDAAMTDFEFYTSRVQIWSPSPKTIDRIAHAITLRDRNLLNWAIEGSLESRCSIGQYLGQQRHAAPTTFRSARAALQEQSQRSRRLNQASPALNKALEAYARCYAAEFIEPLWAEMSSTDDPHRRLLLVGAIEIAEQLHAASEPVRSASTMLAGHDNPKIDQAPLADLKVNCELLERLNKLVRAQNPSVDKKGDV